MNQEHNERFQNKTWIPRKGKLQTHSPNCGKGVLNRKKRETAKKAPEITDMGQYQMCSLAGPGEDLEVA